MHRSDIGICGCSIPVLQEDVRGNKAPVLQLPTDLHIPFLNCGTIMDHPHITETNNKKTRVILLMAEILHHLGCMKPYK